MSTVQVRMEVSAKTSASVHYISQSLGIPVKEVYPLIVDHFLYERDLLEATEVVGIGRDIQAAEALKSDKLPFED